MPKVKTIKAHSNGYGKTFKKKVGDIYENPEPGGDVKAGFVSLVTDKPAPAPSKKDGEGDGDAEDKKAK